jgi:hypothetical protein
MQVLSMVFASFATVAYCVTAAWRIDRFGALRGSVFAYPRGSLSRRSRSWPRWW